MTAKNNTSPRPVLAWRNPRAIPPAPQIEPEPQPAPQIETPEPEPEPQPAPRYNIYLYVPAPSSDFARHMRAGFWFGVFLFVLYFISLMLRA